MESMKHFGPVLNEPLNSRP